MSHRTNEPRVFLRAAEGLEQYVEFGFIFAGQHGAGLPRVRRLPTGRATIFFAFDIRNSRQGAGPYTGLFCEGPQSESFEVTGQVGEVVGVKLRVGGMRALLGLPGKELRDRALPLESIWGPRARFLADAMASACDASKRLALLNSELRRRSNAWERHDPAAMLVCQLISGRAGRVRVSELAASCGLSERSLLQKFDDWAGLTPKQFARLVRLRACIARLDSRSDFDWAELASSCGYFDQAHMIHEFRQLLGQPPSIFTIQRDAYNAVVAPASGVRSLPSSDRRLYRALGFVSNWIERSNSGEIWIGNDPQIASPMASKAATVSSE